MRNDNVCLVYNLITGILSLSNQRVTVSKVCEPRDQWEGTGWGSNFVMTVRGLMSSQLL